MRFLILCAFLSSCLISIGCEHISGYLGYWKRERELTRNFEEDLRPEIQVRDDALLFRNPYSDRFEVMGRPTGELIHTNGKDVGEIRRPSFPLTFANPPIPLRAKEREPAHSYESLDDNFFDPKYGQLGLYNPKALLTHTQRLFFSLEKFDPEKAMVLFIHGMGGTPRDFKYLVNGLDKRIYQPWFYFYPSGMSLQKLGTMLADFIKVAGSTDQVKRLVIVGHSMGGLIALSAMNQLCCNGPFPCLRAYVSFDSPYGGVKAAQMAARMPAVIPSWADIATGSPFLEELYQGNALKHIPLFLFFAYKTGDSSDGTITLNSQLEPRVHFAALKSYGFNTTHVGILNHPESRKVFNQVLSTTAHSSSNLK